MTARSRRPKSACGASRRDNPRLNAFILVMADEARRAGARSRPRARRRPRPRAAARRPDLGQGSARHPRHADDRGVARARGTRRRRTTRRRSRTCAQAGAVIIGKTNLHEFAFGTTNEDSAFGPARNPHDPTRSPGGSSGGSAVSVAAGMALATLGTDTGGSIRIPAAACGMVGLKPTIGEMSTDGVVPLSRTLDHVGPLARSGRRRVARAIRRCSAARTSTTAGAEAAQRPATRRAARLFLRSARRRGARARSRRRSTRCAPAGAHDRRGRRSRTPT